MPDLDAILTPRLLLRRPELADAPAIFTRYSSDPEVTRWLAWPRHRDLEETLEFIAWSDGEWQRWPAGPMLIFERAGDGALLGGTGLAFTSSTEASTGYVLARTAWGQGYATEALTAMVDLAARCGVRRLDALCHAGHRASAHVLEKCQFTRIALLERQVVFPNAEPGERLDVLQFARLLEPPGPQTDSY